MKLPQPCPQCGADIHIPPGWKLPLLWQFTDGSINDGPFPGLGRVDQSRVTGAASLDELRAAWAS